MANEVPKIVYGSGPTTIQFTYPPEKDDGEERAAKVKTTVSLSGVLQTIREHVEATRKIVLSHLSNAEKEALETFFDDHASLGSSFQYYEHSDEVTYKTYTLDDQGFKFKPKKIAYRGTEPVWKVELVMRRVIA